MGRRLLRVNEAVKEVVSTVLAGELSDPRLGFVTVTGVETTSDLRHAKVFVSVLGRPGDRDRTLEALAASHGVIQARLAATVRIKRTPQLEFVYDETTDKAMRITTMIDSYLADHPEPPEPLGDELASADESLASHPASAESIVDEVDDL